MKKNRISLVFKSSVIAAFLASPTIALSEVVNGDNMSSSTRKFAASLAITNAKNKAYAYCTAKGKNGLRNLEAGTNGCNEQIRNGTVKWTCRASATFNCR